MRNTLIGLALVSTLAACSHSGKLIDEQLVDELLARADRDSGVLLANDDLRFWKSRAEMDRTDFVSQGKYGRALLTRFRSTGAIEDLLSADTILARLAFALPDAEIQLQLAGIKMLRHQFAEARRITSELEKKNLEPYATAMMAFDAELELGEYGRAAMRLRQHPAPRDFAYLFRASRQEHQLGHADSAIAMLRRASDLVPGNKHLQNIALSNAADLSLHEGRVDQARELYQQALERKPADYHSLCGLAWIAAAHDEDTALAFRVFRFVAQRSTGPDILFRMAQATTGQAAKNYGERFFAEATKPSYGSMYHKYLIQLLTGVLDRPDLALPIARKEVELRPTAQTAAWLAWTQFRCGQRDAAYAGFKNFVSGRPLETLELFWMGKMLKELGRKQDAKRYLDAARANRYDLSLSEMQELEP